ncbi:hypothetical protein [Nocardioides alcanivorans]|uniref:hypothetical protein n=1 Tax=Nocardioides alcanivorans TaxID=2897352 RepID=UPI001F3CEC08|nr:hypothetical protein [Nocardioides alcanivorans]
MTPLVVGDLAVIGVHAYDSMLERSQRWIVALDAATGRTRWSEEFAEETWGTCIVLPREEQLVCGEERWDETNDTASTLLTVRDVDHGRVVASHTFDHRLRGMVGMGDQVWTLGGESDWTTGTHRIHVTAGSVDDLVGDVDRETRLVDDEEYGGEDWSTLETDGERLWASVAGKPYRVDVTTGELTEQETWTYVGRDAEGQPLVVQQRDGLTWFEGEEQRWSGYLWDLWGTRPQVRRGLVGFGGELVRRDSGEVVRTVVDDDNGDVTWVNDDVLRVSRWPEDGESEIWFETALGGEVLWRDRERRWTYAATSDAFLSFTPDSDHFDVRSVWSGDLAWSRELPVTEASDDGSRWSMTTHISTWSGGVVVTSSETMFGFADFDDPDPDLLERPVGLDEVAAEEPKDDLALGEDYVTACGSEPEFTPISSEAVSGSVAVTFEVSATCPSGQWLDSPAYRIDLTGSDDDGSDVPLATGRFDFSDDNRVWIPAEGTSEVTTGFPVKQVWATPEEIGSYIGRGAILVDCEREESGSGEELAPQDPAVADAGGADSADDVTDPDTREENSLQALRRIAAQDKEHVLENLAGQWMPQLSSKQDGTHDSVDARTYDYTAIYEEHLRLRLDHPDVRLLWSGDWGSYERDDYWVTVVGQGSNRAKPALQWCADSGRAPSQCYAKLVRVSGPPEGTTRLQR